MANPNDIENPGKSPTPPTDKGEDSEERRNAAEQAWKDKQGIPRGTPEQGERSAKPEIDDDTNESAAKRAPEVDDDDDDGSAPKNT